MAHFLVMVLFLLFALWHGYCTNVPAKRIRTVRSGLTGRQVAATRRGDRSQRQFAWCDMENIWFYVGMSTTVHNLLFCAQILCMKNVTGTFLLVSSSGSSKHLLQFCARSRSTPKRRTKAYWTKNSIVGLNNHLLELALLTLVRQNEHAKNP